MLTHGTSKRQRTAALIGVVGLVLFVFAATAAAAPRPGQWGNTPVPGPGSLQYGALCGGSLCDPSNCGCPGPDISLTPATATNVVGTSHTVTATVTYVGIPLSGTLVVISVVSGPNAGASDTGFTSAGGKFELTYTGGATGTDHIRACLAFTPVCSVEVTKEWVVPAVPMTMVSTASVTLRQSRPGVPDDRLTEVGEFTLASGTLLDPVAVPVVVTLSESSCGGMFSTLDIPAGAFVKFSGGRVHLFSGSLTDGTTGEAVQTYVRIAQKVGDTYLVSLDLQDADYTCLEGSTNRRVTTTIDIGSKVISGDECFARQRSGDLYYPVKGATCP